MVVCLELFALSNAAFQFRCLKKIVMHAFKIVVRATYPCMHAFRIVIHACMAWEWYGYGMVW